MSETDDQPTLFAPAPPQPGPLRRISVQAVNRLVMQTEDLSLLEAWLEEEKGDARRRSALHRIYHRFNMLRSRRDHAELDRIANGEG